MVKLTDFQRIYQIDRFLPKLIENWQIYKFYTNLLKIGNLQIFGKLTDLLSFIENYPNPQL